jgi:hypothetical protein
MQGTSAMRVIVAPATSILIAASIVFGVSRGFAADIAERNVEELFIFLQTGNYAVAESHFGTDLKAAMPATKLKDTWGQMTTRYGRVKSFRVIQPQPGSTSELRIVNLNFEHAPPKPMVAQVKISSSGEVQELIFRSAEKDELPPKASRPAPKKPAPKAK